MIRLCKVTGGYATMDTETKEKLTEQQHQIDLLREKVEAKMESMEAKNKAFLIENVSTIDRLQSSNEQVIGGLRTDIEKALGKFRTITEKNFRFLFLGVAVVVGLGFALLGMFIAYLQLFK